MEELTTEESLKIQGGALSGVKAISVGNTALAMNIDVNVLSGNGGGGGLNTVQRAVASAGTFTASASLG